ncbi:hypothetical protein L873DRAFT_1271652 [Choiromyces venosus 120613-1]|uniref:Histone-lysine N-methyltransferase SET9 n=1 Tax=Choiromyces venosus 120613-1 TaxID=1336337 RepID=A0A3N4JCQ8_9PEZI|nr:hypothetical protein L873DRAFT_1271652 [Choiromyces venosus 120613-1]
MPSSTKQKSILSLLAEYDDFLTDSLVDRVHYWTTIRKIKGAYHPSHRLNTKTILGIVIEDVVKDKNVKVALEKFMRLPGVVQYLRSGTHVETEFLKHARRYLSIYQPDAAFEVASTNRFDPTRPEACVLARKDLRRGEMVKYLTGVLVKMSDNEEQSLSQLQSDFSIIYSSRVGAMSLLLGPARFINHDCEPNCKFTTTGKEHVNLYVERDIKTGEEITVKYADDYFGEGNRECLCRTCEGLGRSGWASEAAAGDPQLIEEDGSEIQAVAGGFVLARRSKRKRNSTHSPAIQETKKQKVSGNGLSVLSPPNSIRGLSEGLRTTPPVPDICMHSRSSTPMLGVTGPETPPETDGVVTPMNFADVSRASALLCASGARVAEINETQDCAPNSLPMDTLAEGCFAGEDVQSEAVANPPRNELQAQPLPQITIDQICDDHVSGKDLEQPTAVTRNFLDDILKESESNPQYVSNDELSDFTEVDDSDFDDETQTIDIKRLMRKQRAKKGFRGRECEAPHLHHPELLARRVPGDYLTQIKSSISCICSNCRECFFHSEKFNIPTTCKRCERHTKIYKFGWPKTVGKKNETVGQSNSQSNTQRSLVPKRHGGRR